MKHITTLVFVVVMIVGFLWVAGVSLEGIDSNDQDLTGDADQDTAEDVLGPLFTLIGVAVWGIPLAIFAWILFWVFGRVNSL